ncbi:hypothetical protein FJY71_07360, partial [candidate division WOR-3 bacterium]|nr:hypothetical protein [candidate division WOR-3 bacterium]
MLGLLLTAALTQLAAAGVRGEMAVLDSLREMPRWEQVRWLARRGLPDPYLRAAVPADSGSLRCVGRWSFGPSYFVDLKVTAGDTIIFLSRGSGVSVIRFRSRDSLSLELLADINCAGLTGRLAVQDSLLYVSAGGLETYDISDLTQPSLLGRLSFAAYDCFIKDTFLYTVNRESLGIYSVSDPANPRLLGGCRDSAYVMHVSGNYAYLGDQYGLYILDVSNPANPHRVSTIGGDIISVTVRDSLLLFGTASQGLKSYDVADPASPIPLGTLPGVQPACLYLPPTCDTVLYTPTLDIINITNPANPRIIGQVSCPGWDYGVTVVPALNYALVADYFEGMVAVDIGNPTSPAVDTARFAADIARDISVQDGLAALADEACGLILLDVSDPGRPTFLGQYDTVGTRPWSKTAALMDSFAFLSWPRPRLVSVNVADPTSPERAAGCEGMFNQPEDIALHDSLLYCAEASRFQVVNVARPRQPVLVGSCTIGDLTTCGLALWDTLAYVNAIPGLWMLSIANPAAPRVIDTAAGRRLNAVGVAVRDTVVFIPSAYDTLWVTSAADPTTLRYISGVPLGPGNMGSDAVVAEDTLVYVATASNVTLVNVKDLERPFIVATSPTPSYTRRLFYRRPYLYAACTEGGVMVFDSAVTGVGETLATPRVTPRLVFAPNPARRAVTVRVPGSSEPSLVLIRDVAGR